jgi:hypothetical protein
MWVEFLRGVYTTIEFHQPSSVFQLDEAESKLGLKLPDELRSILCETNGVTGEYGLGLLWPIQRIVEDNLKFREDGDLRDLYMPFDHLLFVADAGNGDQFAYSIRADGAIHHSDIFAWDHENDSRTWVAASLKQYFEWWENGSIKL